MKTVWGGVYTGPEHPGKAFPKYFTKTTKSNFKEPRTF